MWCVCSNLYPLVFIAGSHGLFLAEPTWGANELLPRRRSKVVGPMGWPADQGGRPATPWRQPPPNFFWWACLGLLLSKSCGTACLNWICFGSWATLGSLSLNRCSDNFCDFMSGQSVLATCILAQKHILHISKGEVWFRGLFG